MKSLRGITSCVSAKRPGREHASPLSTAGARLAGGSWAGAVTHQLRVQAGSSVLLQSRMSSVNS